MLSYLFIVNPVAGKKNIGKITSHIQEVMEKNNCTYEIKKTEKVGDAEVFAQEAKNKDYSTIVSVGGDGTLHEVVNGMLGGVKKLGVVPTGTGNDFARSLGIPMDIKQSIEVLVKRNFIKADIGRLNGNCFVNFCSIGLDALIAEEANKIKKYFSSTYAYIIGVVKGLARFKSIKVELVIDGKKYEEEIMLAAICNGAYYGGGMKIAPDAEIDDGLFDICVVRKMSKLKLLFLFPSIFTGKHVSYDEVKMYRGKDVQVLSKDKFNVNADGEIVSNRPIRMQMLENEIEVIVP